MQNRQFNFDQPSAPRSRLVNMRKRAKEIASAPEESSIAINFSSKVQSTSAIKAPVSEASTIDSLDSQSIPVVNIAPTQATSSLNVSQVSEETCDAIMAIQESQDQSQINREIAKLRKISAQIKAEATDSTLIDLGASIDKFLSIVDKKTEITVQKEAPIQLKQANQISVNSTPQKPVQSITKPAQISINQTQTTITSRPLSTSSPTKLTAKKHTFARKNAPARVKSDSDISKQALEKSGSNLRKQFADYKPRKRKVNKFRLGVAIASATACVIAVCSVIYMNIPDISVRVAALQTGIEARYPGYVPRDFSLTGVESEEGKITMFFKGPEDAIITISEEKSSWDSSALLRNYVTENWNESYITTHEQGITIYISDYTNDAAWVSGGILYKINSTNTSLTKKQIRNIALSL